MSFFIVIETLEDELFLSWGQIESAGYENYLEHIFFT
jgi:hypothetical protein